MILSLQGCMAVGKTTAARYLQAHDPQLHVCFEDNAAVIAEVKHRGLDKNCYADYLEIQRLFLQNEVRRWQEAQKYPCTVMDFGAEEIVFYTLHYPKSKGLDWGMEELRRALAPEPASATEAGMVPEPGGHDLFADRRPDGRAGRGGGPPLVHTMDRDEPLSGKRPHLRGGCHRR